MPRPFRTVAVALPLFALLAACGSQEATQGSVRDDVRDALAARPDLDLDADEIGDTADCISREMFESGDFSKDERNEITRASDGEAPSPALVERVVALFTGCGIEPGLLEPG